MNLSDVHIKFIDTVPLSAAAIACGRIRQLSMASMLAESIRRVSNEESISAMFR